MPIRTYWDTPEKTIAIQIYDGKWDVTDIHNTFDSIITMSDEIGSPICIITDITNARMAPVNALTILSRLERVFRTYVDINVLLGANSYIRTLTNIATHLAPKQMSKIYFADSMEEARNIIATETSKLANK